MTESTTIQAAEILAHRGYRISLTQAGIEWIAAVTVPEQRPMVIMAPDRESAIRKAYTWVDLQLASDRTSE